MRNEKGQFVPGYTPPDWLRKKNSEAQIRRHAKAREFGHLPDLKKCSKCNEVKRVPDDYTMKRKKRKDGSVSILPSSECKACKRIRNAKWRQERRDKGLSKEDAKRWNANRDREQQRKYWREYQAVRRRKQGCKVVGPWKKYREGSRMDSIPIEPLQEFIRYQKEVRGFQNLEIARLAGVDDKRIRNILSPVDQVHVTSDVAERIIKAIDPDIHLAEVYPELYPDDA